ncbi:MAG: dTDP-glucose 4,6-dehydratase [Gammaproteobacteria bacterium]|nr:dTDP-glucose 4,6-dehydratase [Gammaproteobacteria bacterium]
MSNLLVTGGAGFIGSNFVHYWREHHPRDVVVVLDKLTYAGNLDNLASVNGESGFHFVHGDICDERLVLGLLREHSINTIVNFAAESHVDRSISGPDEFVQTNVIGTHALLKAARAVWLESDPPVHAHRFHQISTDEVFGSLGDSDPPVAETARYAPSSPYAASKAAADHLVSAYHRTYGLQTTISNCSNNFGPFHFPEKLIPLVIVNLLHGRAVPLYGDGRNVRDWLFVTDHCRGIERILQHGKSGSYYNIGGNNEWTNLDLVRKLCQLMDDAFAGDPLLCPRFPASPAAAGGTCASLISFVRDRPGHDFRYALDFSKCAAELDYSPRESIGVALSRTIQWYLDNEQWWRRLIDADYQAWVEQQYGAATRLASR